MKNKHLILVVDDSPTVRRLITLILTKRGYDVITAVDGQDGFEVAKREEPSVILVDFVMPRMNGFEFCRNIRADAKLAHTPIILITSKDEKVGKAFQEKFGISHYLHKPFKPEDLLKSLKSVLSGTEIASNTASKDIPAKETLSASLQEASADSAPEEVAPEPSRAERSDHARGKMPSPPPQPDEYPAHAVWESISHELTALLKRVVMQTLKETGVDRVAGRIFSGDITYMPVGDVIKYTGMSGISGRLSVITDEFSSEIYLKNGQVIFASMLNPERSACLAKIITNNGSPPSAEILSCLAEAGGSSLAVGRILFQRGLMTDAELNDYYRRLSEEAVNTALSATSGHFFLEDVPLPEEVQNINPENKASLQAR